MNLIAMPDDDVIAGRPANAELLGWEVERRPVRLANPMAADNQDVTVKRQAEALGLVVCLHVADASSTADSTAMAENSSSPPGNRLKKSRAGTTSGTGSC
jgi:hypothetical protein